ncbi:DUF4956 domain-containing protein [Runella sp. MFBS21]|uniref:DUF4956 domain-containing protein n=1 Tax=Runella sp. MFBS21 TaxID=3034018 RepID=UPI0023F7A077|nr:DUF4956 domain-containing protein [Runella sp. MFBS21]MDF7820036.1 DUF4956 domain-containing protein [Runella sp. MFBS21]
MASPSAHSDLFFQIGLDIFSMVILLRLIYFPTYRNTEFVFTFFVFNLIIFSITYLLNQVEVSMGAAFGLFAVFSMLRYRTEGISMRDMTYLFLVIALGLIHGIAASSVGITAIMTTLLLFFTYVFEGDFLYRREHIKEIMYDKISLITAERRQELIDDIQERTGLKINRVEVEKLDFLRDVAYLKIYYY